jgi:elongation factor G
MKKYETKDLRTVVFAGHGKCGKTSLAEAFLFDSEATSRLGSVDDETSTLDTEPEELKRKHSLQLSVGDLEWKKRKINLIVTPGDGNFAADAEMGTSVADSAVIVVSAPDGVQVGTERAWRFADSYGLPCVVYVNKLDRDRADFDRTLAEVKDILSSKAVAMQIPIGQEGSFTGVVDLLSLKAATNSGDGRKVEWGDVPADLQDQAASMREELVEGIASSDDELLERYLDAGELTEEEISQGLATAILNGSIVPVLCGSATRNIGVQPIMDFIVNSFPSPLDRPPVKAEDGTEIKQDPTGDFTARVFKTISADIGKIALVKIVSGRLVADSTVSNSSKRHKERVGQLYLLNGKKRDTTTEVVAGDIVGLAKLKDTKTGDSLCDDKVSVIYPKPHVPDPVIGYVVRPKSKGDEEKVAQRLHDLLEEDISLVLDRDSSGTILRGLGQGHIEIAVEKLKRLGVEVDLEDPRVPYRETIKGKAEHVEGKHKKQSGGRGQFGVCFIDMEPKPKDSDSEDSLEFVDAIFGGSVPKQFIPAIEKGIRTRMARGVIAGFPVVNIKVTLRDGKFHPVDSDGRSFEMAGSKGFMAGVNQAKPVLLEPVMEMRVVCPEENMGDIIGDVSSRRGKVLGTEASGHKQIIRAHVPMSEVLRYAIDLESITAGRGEFTTAFSHYEEVPSNLTDKIIAASKVEEDDD